MSPFRYLSRMFGLLVLVSALLVSACDNQEAEAPADTGAAVDDAPASDDGIVREVASIDADGNVAPFGMAARKPVPIEDPPDAQPAAQAAGNSQVYATQCAACHGVDAQGVEGLGLTLAGSDFVGRNSEEQLVAFLKAGRALDDPDNVTGVPMPAFAWMDDAQLQEVSAYVKGL